jgi:predicted DNA-binding protein
MTAQREGSPTLSVRLPDDLFPALEKLARRNGTTASEIVRLFIREALRDPDLVPALMADQSIEALRRKVQDEPFEALAGLSEDYKRTAAGIDALLAERDDKAKAARIEGLLKAGKPPRVPA